MKNLIIYTLCSAILVCGSSCATIVNGSRQDLRINKHPGSTVVLQNSEGLQVSTSVSPCIIRVKRSRAILKKEFYTIEYTKEGKIIERKEIYTSLNGWLFGNIISFDLIGLVVDFCTGAIFTVEDEK